MTNFKNASFNTIDTVNKQDYYGKSYTLKKKK